MTASTTLVLTVLENGTTVTMTESTDDWVRVVDGLAPHPRLAQLSTAAGEPLVYLMIDGEQSHLSVWTPGECHYLARVRAVTDDWVDLGWNSYPAAFVTDDLSHALRAAEHFVARGERAEWANWVTESIEL